MKECYACGVNEDSAVLYEGVGKEGVVPVCRKCFFKNKIPLITTKEVSREELPGESVRVRLSRMAGIKASEEGYQRVKPSLQDVSLRDIIEKNFREKMGDVKAEEIEGLIPNFHWVVMRKRRQKKMTQKELAEAILEPISAIEYLEKGILPKEHVKFIQKIERVLGVKLLVEARKIFDPSSLAEEAKVGSDFTVGELKKASEKRGFFGFFKRRDGLEKEELNRDFEEFSRESNEANFGHKGEAEKEFEQVIKEAFDSEPVEVPKRVENKPKKDYSGKKELSQKEIDDILFRGR